MWESYMMLRSFFLNPQGKEEKLLNNDEFLWIDYGKDNKEIIDVFNEKLPNEDKLDYSLADCKDGKNDLLYYIKNFLNLKYDVRGYKCSVENNKGAFIILTNSFWNNLENEFGKEKVDFYFFELQKDN